MIAAALRCNQTLDLKDPYSKRNKNNPIYLFKVHYTFRYINRGMNFDKCSFQMQSNKHWTCKILPFPKQQNLSNIFFYV